MVKIKYIVTASILVAAGVVIFFSAVESQESKIKKQFDFIAEKIKKSSGESPIISSAKAKSLTKVFAKTCFIRIPAYSFSKKIKLSELPSYVLGMRSQYSAISLSFYDFFFEQLDEKECLITVTAGMRGILKSGDVPEDIQEVSCRLQKFNDAWKFIEIEVVEVLKK